ncbi:MAG: twin-arginine translocase subunit TatC [Acidobacteria bacterium]|nr:twin-arginine translocase subunit TatC [Acidobacteriota bacterium]
MTENKRGDSEAMLPLEQEELSDKMSFLEHLEELRTRILYSLVGVGITFVICFIFNVQLFHFIAAPIRQVLPPGQKDLFYLTPTESFGISMKVSLLVGIFLASPFILWQLWLFISPGLYRREKAYALPFLFASSTLFLMGGIFAYYIALPRTLNFLINFNPELQPLITATEFFDFATLIMVGMGVVFQLPILIGFLSLFGIVTPRFLLHNFKFAVLIIFIIAAVISPTGDAVNLFVFALPMMALYVVSIGIAFLFRRRHKARDHALSTSTS